MGGVGAALIGTAVVWPFMRKLLREYDNAHNIEAGGKDVGVAAGVEDLREADTFQRKVADKLKPVEVDPEDKSMGAFFKRFRNKALSGVTHDIHADIKHDEGIMDMHDTAEKFGEAPPDAASAPADSAACSLPACPQPPASAAAAPGTVPLLTLPPGPAARLCHACRPPH